MLWLKEHSGNADQQSPLLEQLMMLCPTCLNFSALRRVSAADVLKVVLLQGCKVAPD